MNNHNRTAKSYVATGVCIILMIATIIATSLKSNSLTVEAGTILTEDQNEEREWFLVSDEYYGYSFQIPADWSRQMGATPDRWIFFSNTESINAETLHPNTRSVSLIKVDFGVEPVANLLPEPEVRNPLIDELGEATSESLIPLLPTGVWSTNNGTPVLTIVYDENALNQGHGGEFSEVISSYILGKKLVYYLWVAYAPANVTDQQQLNDDYQEYQLIKSQIINSFVISPNPIAATP